MGSDGQPACLLFRSSEFESRRSLQFFFYKIVFEKNENKQNEAGVGQFFLKRVFTQSDGIGDEFFFEDKLFNGLHELVNDLAGGDDEGYQNIT